MMRTMRSRLQPKGSAPVGAGRVSRCTSTSSSWRQRCTSSRLRGTCRTRAPTAVCRVSGWRLVCCEQAFEQASAQQLPEGYMLSPGAYGSVSGECLAFGWLQAGFA